MKKLFFTMLMAVSTIAVAMADGAVTSLDNVECGQTVIMTATANTGYRFKEWQWINGETVQATYDAANSGNGYTCTADGVLRLEITGAMIDADPSGLNFKAIFDARWHIWGKVVDEAGNQLMTELVTNSGYYDTDANVTLVSNYTDACYDFLKWQKRRNPDTDEWDDVDQTSPSESLELSGVTADAEYRAVYKKKSVSIHVTSDPNGSVSIQLAPSSNN